MDALRSFARTVAAFASRHAAILVPAACALALLSAIAIPMAILSLPEDYFSLSPDTPAPPLPRLARAGRNLCGAILLGIGLLLFFPPGLGSVFMVAGIILLDFPGKRRLERKACRWRGVLPMLNLIRRLGRKPPFQPPPGIPPARRTDARPYPPTPTPTSRRNP